MAMTSESCKSKLPSNNSTAGDEASTHDVAARERSAMQAATTRVLKQISQSAEHELIVAISAEDALEELVPLLDRLLAVGEAAQAQDTEDGWREAHGRLLNSSVLIRVAELRYAIGVKMDYVPSKSGDREDVLEWVAALRRLRTGLQSNGLMSSRPT